MNTLKHHRNKSGYTQEKLARLIECDQALIQKMESGKRKITERYRERLVKVLTLSAQYNFEQKDYVKEIVSNFNELSFNGRKKIMSAVHYFRFVDGLASRPYVEF